MTAKLEENIHHIFSWHRVEEVLPLLEKIMVDLELEIDKEMLDADPGHPDHIVKAAAAWAERRAIDKFRKALTKIIKKGKTAAKVIAPSM